MSLMLLRYSDGLMRWLDPSALDPFGKAGGTNGSTSCLLTRFGPAWLDDDSAELERDWYSCCDGWY